MSRGLIKWGNKTSTAHTKTFPKVLSHWDTVKGHREHPFLCLLMVLWNNDPKGPSGASIDGILYICLEYKTCFHSIQLLDSAPPPGEEPYTLAPKICWLNILKQSCVNVRMKHAMWGSWPRLWVTRLLTVTRVGQCSTKCCEVEKRFLIVCMLFPCYFPSGFLCVVFLLFLHIPLAHMYTHSRHFLLRQPWNMKCLASLMPALPLLPVWCYSIKVFIHFVSSEAYSWLLCLPYKVEELLCVYPRCSWGYVDCIESECNVIGQSICFP